MSAGKHRLAAGPQGFGITAVAIDQAAIKITPPHRDRQCVKGLAQSRRLGASAVGLSRCGGGGGAQQVGFARASQPAPPGAAQHRQPTGRDRGASGKTGKTHRIPLNRDRRHPAPAPIMQGISGKESTLFTFRTY